MTACERGPRDSTHLETATNLEHGAHDGESDESHEDEDQEQHAARDHLGEDIELAGDELLITARDVAQTGDDVAGVFADR